MMKAGSFTDQSYECARESSMTDIIALIAVPDEPDKGSEIFIR